MRGEQQPSKANKNYVFLKRTPVEHLLRYTITVGERGKGSYGTSNFHNKNEARRKMSLRAKNILGGEGESTGKKDPP